MDWKISIERPCDGCNGSGWILEEIRQEGRKTITTPEHACSKCRATVDTTPGVISEKVTLTQLKVMLDRL